MAAKGPKFGLTYSPAQCGSLPPHSIWVVDGSVPFWVHADTVRKHARFHCISEGPPLIAMVLLPVRPEEPSSTVLLVKSKLCGDISRPFFSFVYGTLQRTRIQRARPFPNHKRSPSILKYTCYACERLRRRCIRIHQ